MRTVEVTPSLKLHRAPMRTACCLCGDAESVTTVHVYERPPIGETKFEIDEDAYRRDLRRCDRCGHFTSVGTRIDADIYRGDYSKQTYGKGDAKGVAAIRRGFERVAALRPGESDNVGRVQRVDAFARRWLNGAGERTLVDVGAGLGVFIDGMQRAGWSCTGIDPDPNACEHLRTHLGSEAHCATLEEIDGSQRFEVLALNKVLEHVADPVAMLRDCRKLLVPRGVMYVEVPDGEMAFADSPGREEFFIEHLHAFSMASFAMTMQLAGLTVIESARLREPSGKYTLFAFASVGDATRCVMSDCEAAD